MRKLVVAVAVVAALVAGYWLAFGLENEADHARVRWDALDARWYTFHFAEGCFCGMRRGTITVADGKVIEWRPDAAAGGTTPAALRTKLSDLPTIASLLDRASDALDDADKAHFTFDPKTGVPVSGSIDPSTNAMDDEYGWTITDFHQITSA